MHSKILNNVNSINLSKYQNVIDIDIQYYQFPDTWIQLYLIAHHL